MYTPYLGPWTYSSYFSWYSKFVKKKTNLRFYTNCRQTSQPVVLNQLWVWSLPHRNIHLILDLDFLLAQDGSVLLTKDYIIFLFNAIIAPILSNYSLKIYTPSMYTQVKWDTLLKFFFFFWKIWRAILSQWHNRSFKISFETWEYCPIDRMRMHFDLSKSWFHIKFRVPFRDLNFTK